MGRELLDLMEEDENTGALKHPEVVEPLEKLYDTLPKHDFTFREPNLGKDLEVEYVLINSSQRPPGEKSPAFTLCQGINFLMIAGYKIFICEDLVPNNKFFKYVAIHEVVHAMCCHGVATEVEFKIAEQELNDDELRDYCHFRYSMDDYVLNGPDGLSQRLRERLPDKVKRFLKSE
jgi:hypothetical protein